MTGTCILQSIRSVFNQVTVDPTCMLCEQEPETAEHFQIECSTLDHVRQPILQTFHHVSEELLPSYQIGDTIVQLVLDPSTFLPTKKGVLSVKQTELHRHAKRLCHSLHLERLRDCLLFHPKSKER